MFLFAQLLSICPLKLRLCPACTSIRNWHRMLRNLSKSLWFRLVSDRLLRGMNHTSWIHRGMRTTFSNQNSPVAPVSHWSYQNTAGSTCRLHFSATQLPDNNDSWIPNKATYTHYSPTPYTINIIHQSVSSQQRTAPARAPGYWSDLGRRCFGHDFGDSSTSRSSRSRKGARCGESSCRWSVNVLFDVWLASSINISPFWIYINSIYSVNLIN